MFGEPPDVEGECNARLFLADNYGDGTATIRCQLPCGHENILHQEQFERQGGLVTITWVTDEREKCDHGCGQWRHAHATNNGTCPKNAPDHRYSDCAYCHPGREGRVCATCGKTYYHARGHQRFCQEGTGRPEDTVACPACAKEPGSSCEGPSSHPARLRAYQEECEDLGNEDE